jgi:hypothetical protein
MSSPTELKAQLARTEQALLEAEKEIERQRLAAAAEAEIPEGAKALIAAVSKVDLPAFWDADPVLWFRQCESAFRRAGTVSSGVKFDHVVGKLPNAVSLSCRSLLLSINFEDKDAYERLKEHLCKNYSKSKWQQGYALLDHPGLCDRRPFQLLQDMRALLPEKETEGVLFQCLFLKRLPPSDLKQLQRFLGLINFYWRFLPGIAGTLQPLTDLLHSNPKTLVCSESAATAFCAAKAPPLPPPLRWSTPYRELSSRWQQTPLIHISAAYYSSCPPDRGDHWPSSVGNCHLRNRKNRLSTENCWQFSPLFATSGSS